MTRDHWLTVAGWIVAPILAALAAGWAWLHRQVNTHDVALAKLEVRVNSVEAAIRAVPEIRELISKDSERLARMETTMAALAEDLREQHRHIEALLKEARRGD